jgi:hypothetical protein
MPRLARRSLLMASVAGTIAAAACSNDTPRTAADSQAAHIADVVAAGGTVDSILPIAEQLRRFREGIDPVDTLRHAAATRDALVRRFLAALSANDTATLTGLSLDRAEFAHLYYPGSAISLPPYEAPPQLLWGQILASSNEGLPKALTRVGGQPVALDALRCPDSAKVEERNRLHQNCEITIRVGGAPAVTGRWFGTIIERDGRFKFIGYANAL